jgi:polygalacturonase
MSSIASKEKAMKEKKRFWSRESMSMPISMNYICNNAGVGATYPRPHSVSIVEFGAIGDGITLNTHAFQNAIFYLHSFADKGGAQLYVPSGRWLTGSFNLTSHLTLFLERDAIILGSQVVDP